MKIKTCLYASKDLMTVHDKKEDLRYISASSPNCRLDPLCLRDCGVHVINILKKEERKNKRKERHT